MGKVYTLNELIVQRAEWKLIGKTVVFTNGVFDILHRGHVEYLSHAKAIGDILIVGVNTDLSVKRIKGQLRPIVEESDRAYVLSQLTAVDAVCLFEDDTPYDLIKAVVPDILVKGADYTIENIVGRDIVEQSGGKVQTILFVPDKSTTNIIDRIKQTFAAQ